MEKNNKRSSILKRPVAEDSSPTFTKSRRRISFSEKKNVKVFAPGNGGATIWIKSYEESAEIAPANSNGSLYGGPLATPELVMRLRNNKVVSKVPRKVSNKARDFKGVKGVENVSPANTSNEGEEQLCRKFGESIDISLSVSEMQQLLKVKERLPLQPITQYSKQIEEAESYVSPQASLTCQSPEKIYCSFAVTNNDIRALSIFDNGKKLDLTLADIIRDYDKKILHRNHESKNLDVNLTPMDVVNERSASAGQVVGNTSKPKRETMFNLENMELVSVQKTPSNRSTVYYYDSLELSLKNNEEQRMSLRRLKPMDTPREIQENLVKDCDKENREVDVDNTNMELSFDSIMHDVNIARNKNDINKENRGYLGNDDFMDLSKCKSAVQTVNRPQKQLLVLDFTTQKESDLDKIDIVLSPGALHNSMQVKPSKNQETIHQSYGFNLTHNIENKENKQANFIKKDETILKEDQENESMCIPATHGTKNLCNDGKGSALRRQTVNIPCNMDLTLQDELQVMVDESIEPKKRDFKNDQCMNLSIETSQFSIEESKISRHEKIDSRIKRGTMYNHVDLDFTLDEKLAESTEPKNWDFQNDQCMNLSIETSQISREETKVSKDEKTDSRIKRGTLHNYVDLDFTLEEKSAESTEPKDRDFKNDQCMNLSIETSPISTEESKISRHEKIDSRIKRETVYNHVDLDFTLEEKSAESKEPKNWDFKNDQCMNLSIETSQISREESKVSKDKKIDSRIKRETVYNHVDLDFTLEEKSAESTEPKNWDFKNDQCMNLSIETSPISRKESKVSKDEKIDSRIKRETVYNHVDLDFTLEEKSAESTEPKNWDFKNDQCMNLSIETSPISREESKVSKDEKIDSRIKRETVYNHVDLDFTLEEKSAESKEPTNWDFKNDQCMNLSIETSPISREESKVSKDEKIDSRIKRETVYNHVDLDFTLEEKLAESTEPNNWDVKNDQCMNLSIETSQISIEESKVSMHEKIDSRIKRGTFHNYVDLDFTLDAKPAESTEPKNWDFKNDQCMNLSIETSPISREERKVSKDEKIDSRIKRETVYNHVDLDFTLEEKSQGRFTKQADSKGRETETSTNFTKDIKQTISQNEETRRMETTSKSYHVKSTHLHMGERNVCQITATNCGIPQKTNQCEEENCTVKRRSVYTPLDMDVEEEADRMYIKQVDLKKDAEGSLKLKEEKLSKNSNSEQKMNSSISFTQEGRSDVEFMNWSPISASVKSCDEYLPKKNVILSAKRQTIFDQCDLDISMQDEIAKIAESDDKVPVDLKTMNKIDDYDGMNCNLKNNAENNTISSIKRQMSLSSINLDLTIQNDLKNSKKGEVNNEQIVDTNSTITSVRNNIEHHIEPFNRTEKQSCLPIKNKKTPKLDVKEPMTLTSHKLQSSLNILNKSCGKNSNNSVQTFDFSMEEGAKGGELENSQNLKSTEWNMDINSLRNIDLSGCEQLDQTSEVTFCDLSSSNAIDSAIEQIRNAEIVTEMTPEIPRFSRASSSHSNTTISAFSANTTQALCNFDLSKLTKKGYKPNLRTTSDFKCKDKCKDTFFDNSCDCIPPMVPSVPTADENREIDLGISNLNLNCTSKDVNLKNENCENILKSQQTIESKSVIDRRRSSCSRCKACGCKANTGESKREDSIASWKFEAPSQPSKIDFSGYEKFQKMPSIRDILDAHKRRRESLNFESYEESVLCPTIPTMDFLLENYEKQYKLQVKKELAIGAIFPLIPSLEILVSNKLQSENFGWKLNTLCVPVGVMEFRHNILPSVTLILKYSPNSFYSNNEKLTFDKLQLKISKLYGNSSPLDKIIENEICLKAPYDLISYCSCFNDIFSFLSSMNNICERAVQLGKELFRIVVGFNGSLQKDSSDVCFIKKRVLFTPRCNQKGLMSTCEFLVRVKNIENISHTDIMFPPLSDFKESICSIPKGLEFVKNFFFDPISHLKTEY